MMMMMMSNRYKHIRMNCLSVSYDSHIFLLLVGSVNNGWMKSSGPGNTFSRMTVGENGEWNKYLWAVTSLYLIQQSEYTIHSIILPKFSSFFLLFKFNQKFFSIINSCLLFFLFQSIKLNSAIYLNSSIIPHNRGNRNSSESNDIWRA